MMFHEKLQKLRKEKGLSQETLAEMLNVSRQAVSKWESGQSYPEMDKLITLSDIFGVTLDSLIKDNEPEQDNSNPYAIPFWIMRGSVYEYKSKRTLFGLPLIHIHLGHGMKKAKGILAIGNIASGFLAIGLVARGILAFGAVALGLLGFGCFTFGLLLAVGAISIGTIAIGAVAVGIFTLGAVAIGVYSTGALAVASRVAIGDHAYGHIAVGRITEGVKTFTETIPLQGFSASEAESVKQAILEEYPNIWRWVVDLLVSFVKGVRFG